MIPKNESALAGTNRLVKDRFQKSGSTQEQSLTKLAPDRQHSLMKLRLEFFRRGLGPLEL